jgi:RNA polymerase sporulation-specific sigma factor
MFRCAGNLNKINHIIIISIGTVGLIKGIDSFDTDKRVRLITYISSCIGNEILMLIGNN